MSKRPLVNIVIIIIAITAIGFGSYFYYKLHKLDNVTASNKENEVDALILKVSKLYLLPVGERPTIATVSDPLALKDKAFFTSSQKGDKVLIFTKASKAVLYRPSIDKIIEIVSVKNNTINGSNTTNPLNDVTPPIENSN
jgi:hypothetical protein